MTNGKAEKNNKKTLGLVVLLFVLVIGLGTGIFGKYIYDNYGENAFAAKNFYFTSDLLKVEGAEYRLSSNASSVTFTVGNNADELRFSDDTINYSVTTTGGTLSSAEGQLTGGVLSKQAITLSGLEKGQTYTVTVTGDTKNTSDADEIGYVIILKASFKISDDEKYIYTHVETDNLKSTYAVLTVWTGNIKGDVSIGYDGTDLIPDSTDVVLNDVHNYDGSRYGNIQVTDDNNFEDTYSSKSYRFFLDKTNNPDLLKSITEGAFVVTLNDGTTTYIASPGTI
ncbi:MAG: hypothetical protein IJP00_03500 [Firmicutes bacterium]|nr:hypothetical protein [Bacillota bacterium]